MSRTKSTAVAVVAAIICAALVCTLLVAISISRNLGQARVPVLWVSTNEDHSQSGGVSAASIEVESTDTDRAFSVELNANKETAMGSEWNAAASLASAVAALYASEDPRGLQVTFAVDDSIDGASAGAVLTVGVLAALRNTATRSDVAMTGTISPDGSIGSVDGIAAKAQAAVTQGYRTVLIPAAATTDANSGDQSSAGTADGAESSTTQAESSAVDTKALSSALGADIRAVSTIGEAYEIFTGSTIAPLVPGNSELAVGSLLQATRQTAAAQRALSAQLATADAQQLITRRQLAIARKQLRSSRTRLREGDQAAAYAAAVSSLVVLNQQSAVARARALIRERGTAATSKAVSATLMALANRAQRALTASSSRSLTKSPAQQIAAMTALTWLSRSAAVLQAVRDELVETDSAIASDVLAAAKVAAQYSVIVERAFPDSLAIALGITPSQQVEPSELNSFVSGYADLWEVAGRANQQYYETVLTTIADNPDLDFSQPGYLYATVEGLADTTEDLNASGNNYLAQAARALAYFTASTLLVAGSQAYELSGTAIGDLRISAAQPQALKIALAAGLSTVDAYSSDLRASGIDPSHAIWTAQSGASLAPIANGTLHEVAATVTGLQLVWDGAVEAFVDKAARQKVLSP